MAEVNGHAAKTIAHLEAETENRARVSKILFGNGEPGIDKRLDRLEQDERRRKWHFGVLWVAVISATVSPLIGKIWAVISK